MEFFMDKKFTKFFEIMIIFLNKTKKFIINTN